MPPATPTPVPPAQAAQPPAVPTNRPSIGVALEGGGALGIAHVGVLQWMEDNHIPIDRIAGTSMGALVGGLYASGDSPAQLRAIASSDAFMGVFSLAAPYSDLSYRRRQDQHEMPQALTVGLFHGLRLHNALLADRGINEFLLTNMPVYNSENLNFDSMPIPFRCVATDLNTEHPITFSNGPLAEAVRASISIPGVFAPVRAGNGHFLVDGGIVDNLPTDVVRNDLHSDVVIAVHLDAETAASIPDISSILGVVNRAFAAGTERNVEESERLADLVIVVPVGSFSLTDYTEAGQLMHAGYLAAEQYRSSLQKYALNDADWKAYLAARQARMQPPPGLLKEVRVDGGTPRADRGTLHALKKIEGKPITPKTTLDALKRVQSNGVYDATYETFGPSTAAGSSGNPIPAAGDTGIAVHLAKDTIGPPYMLVGPELAATTSNITRAELNLRFIDQNLGGYGSEARANAEVGYRTVLSGEYYSLLTSSGYFLQPHASLVREPVYIWINQKQVAQRFEQDLVAGFTIGRTFSNTAQLSFEYRAQDTRWSLRTGTGGGPYISGTAQTGLFHLNIDKASAAAVSPSGYRLALSAGAFYHAVSSSNAPIMQFAYNRTFSSYKNSDIFGITTEVDSYLRTNVAQPFRFTLGGPMRLSSASFDEYRGTDLYLARAGYMRRIAALPTGLGQGLYALLGYEGGEVWSPEQHAFLRQDGTLGLVGNTPLGLVTVGASIGDAGHRKVFLTIGRWF